MAVIRRRGPYRFRYVVVVRRSIAVTSIIRVSGFASKKIRQSPTRRRKADGWLVRCTTSPVNGFCCMSPSACTRRSRSGRGARWTLFCAGLLTRRTQRGPEVIKGYVVASSDGSTPTADSAQFRGGWSVGPAHVEVGPQRFADQFGSGTVLSFTDCLDLPDHLGWQRNGHSVTRAHGSPRVLLGVTLS